MSTTANLGITKLDAGLRQPEIVINDAFDDFDAAIGGAWQSYIPTWTNLAVGNGTVVAKYVQISKTVVVRVSVVFGSTSSISGAVDFTLPVNRATYGGTSGMTPLGLVRILDASPASGYEGAIVNIAVDKARIYVYDASATYLKAADLSSTIPITWTTSDELEAQFCYEAA